VNVDLTPEVAIRLAAALGTALDRGARVVASRDPAPACRMVKRAIITGLMSTGVDVDDLRAAPSAVARHMLKMHAYDAGIHVGTSSSDPEVVQVKIFEPPGIQLGPALQREIEKHFTRQELRRSAYNEVGDIGYPARVRESYAQDLLEALDTDIIRTRGFRVVVDYGYSAASFVLPLVLGPLGVEAVSAHGFASMADPGQDGSIPELVAQTKRLVGAVGADLGVVFDRAAERIYLVDDAGEEIAHEQVLLLFLRLLASDGATGKLAFPVTVTRLVDTIVDGSGLEVVRTPASLADLTAAAAGDGVIFAGAVGGGYVFPGFLPAYDAVASLCKLLELLAPQARPLSELVAELPTSTVLHREIPCPWAAKGLVMRLLNERFADRDVDITDGIKVTDSRGWVQVLPDPDEPVVHLYAEGEDESGSEELEREIREVVEAIVQGANTEERTPA
jgi:mannose-1-phosphate guanylyltransferase/phosphomannomutase